MIAEYIPWVGADPSKQKPKPAEKPRPAEKPKPGQGKQERFG